MTVRFTTGVSGTTRLDLDVSEDSVYVTDDGFSFGTPALEGEPGAEGAEYGDRVIQFKVIIKGSNATAALVLSALAVELQRERNWLQIQVDDTLPVTWWHTYKSTPGELDLTEYSRNGVPVPGYYQIPVAVSADPKGFGAQQTIAAVTVSNDPNSGTNRQRYVLPAMKGDSPAPLTALVKPSTSWQDSRVLMALVRHDGADPGAVVWQAESFTAGVNTTASTADSSCSGGAKAVVTFASDTATPGAMATRLSGPAPTTPAAGRYRVLARVARSDTASTFAAKLQQTIGTGLSVGNGVTARLDRDTNPAGFATLLDLGDFSFPIGSDGWSAADVGTPPAPVIDFQMQRISGTGQAWIDYFVLIPVDTITTSAARTLRSLFRDAPFPSTRTGVWDAEVERFRGFDGTAASPTMAAMPAPEPRGSYLVADPACTNVFHLHQQVDAVTSATGVNNSDSITATASVSFTYYPRYMWLGSGS